LLDYIINGRLSLLPDRNALFGKTPSMIGTRQITGRVQLAIGNLPLAICDAAVFAVCSMLALTLFPTQVHADELPVQEGIFVTVRYPLDDKEVGRIINVTSVAREDHRKRLKAEGVAKAAPLQIVYDFNPDEAASGSSRYGSCRELAAHFLSLTDVVTIAFVHKDVTGHAVLPVLACQDLVMADGAKIGDAIRDQQEPLRSDQRVFYKEVAEARSRSPALVLKMLDKDVEVFSATRNNAVLYVDGTQKSEGGLVVNRAGGPVFPKGKVALFTTDEALKYELCRLKKQTREEIAASYRMPLGSLREAPMLGRTAEAWVIEVRGALTSMTEETLKRQLKRVAGGGRANFIILQLECGGGDPSAADSLARFIRDDLKDHTGHNPLMTVAYVTEQARDTAIFLALGCTQIVMHKDAHLGDFEAFLKGQPTQEAPMSGMLKDLAEKRYYPPLAVQGMVDRSLVLYRVRSQKNPLQWSIVTEKQLQEEPGNWLPEAGPPLKPAGQLLSLDAATAKKLGLAQEVVEDKGKLFEHLRLDNKSVHQAGPDWLDRFAAFLRLPTVTIILVMLGITCLILEMKMPGVSLPGIISAICFVLFFWAYAQLAFTWLAILLFVLGIVLVALEIFVMPGVAVLGVSGAVLVLASLGLAMMERWPQSETEWMTALTNMSHIGISLVGAVAAAVVLARYLPNIPYANRLVLAPPAERAEPAADEATQLSASRAAALLGAIGVAATPLRPAGMVRFNEDYVDVVAEGSFVQAGARVQVVEIEGNRIVVKEV
jgi:membrane-bound ClpP family serine protease